jgi:Arc/MetJ-type ribon-helix-helix transcriptional regulator
MKPDLEKITIHIPRSLANRLRYLRGTGEIRNTADLIRRLLETFLEERKEGKR